MGVSPSALAPLFPAGSGHANQRGAQKPLAMDELSQAGTMRSLPGGNVAAMAHGLLLSLSDIFDYIR